MNIQKLMLAQALNPESQPTLLERIAKDVFNEENENILIAISRNPNASISTLALIAHRYANYVIENPVLPLLVFAGRFEEIDSILLSREDDEIYGYEIPMIHFLKELPEWLENYIMSGFSSNTHELAYWVKLFAGSKRFTIWCQDKGYDVCPFWDECEED